MKRILLALLVTGLVATIGYGISPFGAAEGAGPGICSAATSTAPHGRHFSGLSKAEGWPGGITSHLFQVLHESHTYIAAGDDEGKAGDEDK